MDKRKKEIRVLAEEIVASLNKAKIYKAQGNLELADEQTDKALRLHVRRKALEDKCPKSK